MLIFFLLIKNFALCMWKVKYTLIICKFHVNIVSGNLKVLEAWVSKKLLNWILNTFEKFALLWNLVPLERLNYLRLFILCTHFDLYLLLKCLNNPSTFFVKFPTFFFFKRFAFRQKNISLIKNKTFYLKNFYSAKKLWKF